MNQKLKRKIRKSTLRDVGSKVVSLKRIIDGAEPLAAGGYVGVGAKTQAAGQFFGKNSILMPLDHISHISDPF